MPSAGLMLPRGSRSPPLPKGDVPMSPCRPRQCSSFPGHRTLPGDPAPLPQCPGESPVEPRPRREPRGGVSGIARGDEAENRSGESLLLLLMLQMLYWSLAF